LKFTDLVIHSSNQTFIQDLVFAGDVGWRSMFRD